MVVAVAHVDVRPVFEQDSNDLSLAALSGNADHRISRGVIGVGIGPRFQCGAHARGIVAVQSGEQLFFTLPIVLGAGGA